MKQVNNEGSTVERPHAPADGANMQESSIMWFDQLKARQIKLRLTQSSPAHISCLAVFPTPSKLMHLPFKSHFRRCLYTPCELHCI